MSAVLDLTGEPAMPKRLREARLVAQRWGVELGRQCNVRESFLYADPIEHGRMLIRLLQRPGSYYVDLKLQLLLLWRAGSDRRHTEGSEPHTAEVSIDDLVALVGLAETRRSAARDRVRSGLRKLRKLELIHIEDQGRDEWTIRLLRDDGSGYRYTPPGKADDRYQALPQEFFTRGWLTQLPGNAIAAYLCIARLSEVKGGRPAFINDSFAEHRIGGFKRATRHEGIQRCLEQQLLLQHRYERFKSGWHHTYTKFPDAFAHDAPHEPIPTSGTGKATQ